MHGYEAIVGLTSDDCMGHGTHVAGTIGGANYGLAKGTRIVAGVAALYLQGTPTAMPQQVRDALYGLTTKGVVTDAGSADNHLLFTNL